MKNIAIVTAVIALLCAGLAIPKLQDVYKQYKVQQEMQDDYAEITKIDYGLFNMQLWKEKAVTVFTDNISQFEVSDVAYKDVKVEIRKFLHQVYDQHIASGSLFDEIFDDAEKEGKVNKVLLRLFKSNIADQIKKLNIKSYIPSMANQMAKELEKNEPQIRQIMQSELRKLVTFEEKYEVSDPRKSIFAKYSQTDLSSTAKYLHEQIEDSREQVANNIQYCFMLLLLAALACIATVLLGGKKIGIVLFTAVSITFLVLGIYLPMIEIDARLNSFVFSLFGHDLSFAEQTIFYQSKSITDITRTLIESNGFDLKLVGLLIFAFSILFPLVKLILTSLYVFSNKISSSKVVKAIIFHLGKWSMADVFVVAMFMAYIGFYGLVDGQLQGIEQNKGGFGIETVNYSRLAPGALFFTTYCILSIVSSYLLSKTAKDQTSTL